MTWALFAVALVVVPVLTIGLVSDWGEYGDGAVRCVHRARVATVTVLILLALCSGYVLMRYGVPAF